MPPGVYHVKGISGSTVLGDGSIALILDIGSITEISNSQENKDQYDTQKEAALCLQ